MRLFQAADAIELSGLTRSQLREWCSRDRRGLIVPDVEAEGPGRHALYSWQTVLVLRVLNEMRREYAVEVGAWAPAMKELRRRLERVSFPSLWTLSAHFQSRESATLVSCKPDPRVREGVFIPLRPHMLPLASRLSIAPPDQLPLFPARAVRT